MSDQYSQFLTDVVTAAGLIAHGKQDKKFAERLSTEAIELRAVLAQEAGKCEPVALSVPDECPHLIVFDDTDRENLLFAGAGSRSAALKTWEKISQSWNAHLFVRVERNSRDDRYPSAHTSQPAPVSVDELQAIQDRHEAWMAGAENGRSEVARLKAENDLLRGGMKGDYDLDAWLDWAKEASFLRTLLKGATIEFRKCSDWICREVEAGTSSATYWAIRMRKQAELIDARLDKVKELNQ